MKRKITLSTLLLAATLFTLDFTSRNLHSNNSGAPAGRTGSPGDGASCGTSTCHNTSATPQLGSLVITSNVPFGGYISGNTYTITVTSGHTTFSKFGFQVSPQAANGALMGSLAITNGTQTQLVGSGKYVTHKSTGTAGTNMGFGFTKQWQFNWTPPAPGSGAVTFYGSSILSNSNNNSNGDSLVLSNLVIQEDVTNGIATSSSSFATAHIFPNPATDLVYIAIPNSYENKKITLINIEGKTVLQSTLNERINKLDISTLSSGIYFIQIENKNTTELIKFVKP
jgi:hypothetical protein